MGSELAHKISKQKAEGKCNIGKNKRKCDDKDGKLVFTYGLLSSNFDCHVPYVMKLK